MRWAALLLSVLVLVTILAIAAPGVPEAGLLAAANVPIFEGDCSSVEITPN